MPRARLPLIDRLAAMTAPPDANGCMIFTGPVRPTGYGSICAGGRASEGAKYLFAHRAAWLCHRGPIPPGMLVLHDCDVKLCVNPAHLHLGDNGMNSREAVERGLYWRGTKLPHTRLTERDIQTIRESKDSTAALARSFGVSYNSIRKIRLRESWGHLP